MSDENLINEINQNAIRLPQHASIPAQRRAFISHVAN